MSLANAVMPVDPNAEIPEVPEGIERGRGGGAKIPDPVTGELITRTRCSSLGKPVTNTFLIDRHNKRVVLHGASRAPEVVLTAAALEGMETREDKDRLDELVERCGVMARADAKAMRGTAFHRLSEQFDAGADLTYLPEQIVLALARYRELMAPFKVVASETFVVCWVLNSAGTFDRVVELLVDITFEYRGQLVTLPAGTRLILDIKTSSTADFFAETFAAQAAPYAYGRIWVPGVGEVDWPDGTAPSQDWAVLLHLPIESLDDAALWFMDLHHGFELAMAAIEVRRLQKGTKNAFVPVNVDLAQVEQGDHPEDLPGADVAATLPEAKPLLAPVPAQVRRVELFQWMAQAPHEEALMKLAQVYADVWDEDAKRMARIKVREFALAVPQ